MSLKIARTVSEIREIVSNARSSGGKIGLVPTMGGLHEGHLSLVHKATQLCDHVIVSIFVNPTQFNKKEDFENYPGSEEKDLAALKKTGADSVFIPSASEMYPEGFNTKIDVNAAENILCDAHRPGHFSGVATVVTKLFLQTGADIACFGEKDYQQLFIIRRLVEDLNIPITIEPVPTIRESDGLAMSSRNERLEKDERQMAPALHETMQSIKTEIGSTSNAQNLINIKIAELESKTDFKVEYLEMRSGKTLQLLESHQPDARLFAAANLGKVRLIDNIAL